MFRGFRIQDLGGFGFIRSRAGFSPVGPLGDFMFSLYGLKRIISRSIFQMVLKGYPVSVEVLGGLGAFREVGGGGLYSWVCEP